MISEDEIKKDCEQFTMSLDSWRRQENAFGLLKKVYAKRAAIRGQQPAPIIARASQWDDWSDDDDYCGD